MASPGYPLAAVLAMRHAAGCHAAPFSGALATGGFLRQAVQGASRRYLRIYAVCHHIQTTRRAMPTLQRQSGQTAKKSSSEKTTCVSSSRQWAFDCQRYVNQRPAADSLIQLRMLRNLDQSSEGRTSSVVGLPFLRMIFCKAGREYGRAVLKGRTITCNPEP